MVKWENWSSEDDPFVRNMVNGCVDCVQLEVLKYLVEEEGFDLKWVVWDTFESVIRAGHIEMLEFLRSNGVEIDVRRGCKVASGAGQLEVLKWFGFEKWSSHVGFVADMVNACIEGVHFELLEFFVSNGFKVRCVHIRSIERVIMKGNLEMLKFLRSNGVEFDDVHKCCAVAAFGGKLHILKWLISVLPGMSFVRTLDFKIRLTESAASGGSVKVLKFLDARGFLSKDAYDACRCAAMNGHLDVLKFLHSKGCKFDIRGCASCAASRGHTMVKEWCLRHVEKFYF
jgi:hypothetical protein